MTAQRRRMQPSGLRPSLTGSAPAGCPASCAACARAPGSSSSRLAGATGAIETTSSGTAEPNGEAPFGLTPRELQVLTLIAEGATNRQIGAALYMAEKTASVHVSRILTKLGVHSRTQAAAVAHRLHLA